MDRSGGLVVVEVKWEQNSGNGWLLREVFELLLRDPDLTDAETRVRMEPEVLADKQGSER